MDISLGKSKKTRRVYGFDEISLVPSIVTINPEDTDVSVTIGGKKFEMPIIASAMDGVISPKTAALMSKNGGLGVLNLHGVWTKYEDAESVLKQIATVEKEKYVELMQKIYLEPVKKELIAKRIKEIKALGGIAAVSSIPQDALEFGKIARDAGVDIFVVQSTVLSTKHKSTGSKILDLKEFCAMMKVPVLVGNCVTYE
ncbi:MAG: IMP dehydrogenase, partial [Candidatus Margulisiibacteriota bacterium]